MDWLAGALQWLLPHTLTCTTALPAVLVEHRGRGGVGWAGVVVVVVVVIGVCV